MVDRYQCLKPFFPLNKIIANYDYFISGKEHLTIPNIKVRVIDFIKDNLITGDDDGYIRIWDLKTQQSILEIKAHREFIMEIIMLNDNRIVTCSGDESFKVWNLKGECLHEERFYLIDFIKKVDSNLLLVGR